MANGDIVTVSQARGLLCQHWGSSGYMMVPANTSQGLAGFKAFWWWCRELKVTGYNSRHRRQWRTLHLMFIIYDHSILRILRMSSWVTKWRWHFMFYFWEGEILSGFWWFWSWTWWIRARIKMMRRVTGAGWWRPVVVLVSIFWVDISQYRCSSSAELLAPVDTVGQLGH